MRNEKSILKSNLTREINILTGELNDRKRCYDQFGWLTYLGEPILPQIHRLQTELSILKFKRRSL